MNQLLIDMNAIVTTLTNFQAVAIGQTQFTPIVRANNVLQLEIIKDKIGEAIAALEALQQ